MPRSQSESSKSKHQSAGSSGRTSHATAISSSTAKTGSSKSTSRTKTSTGNPSASGNSRNSKTSADGGLKGSDSFSGRSETGGSSKDGVYVDNSMNRKLGRVGLPLGSMIESKSGGSESSSHARSSVSDGSSTRQKIDSAKVPKDSIRTSVDEKSQEARTSHSNHVSTPASKSQSTGTDHKSFDSKGARPKIDSAKVPKGSIRTLVDKKTQEAKTSHSNHVSTPASKTLSTGTDHKTFDSKGVRVYKDNPLNRRLQRVGKPLGTMIHSKKRKTKGTFEQTYADTWFNRAHGRVGKPLGSQPISMKTKHALQKQQFFKRFQDDELTESFLYDERQDTIRIDSKSQTGLKSSSLDKSAFEEAIFQINRMLEEVKWQFSSQTDKCPSTSKTLIKCYTGQRIKYEELKLGKQIGHGGFGDVYFATWKEDTVAVKTLRQQTVSNARLESFTNEILHLCSLGHPNIVKFIGACVDRPNLAIVMEYMQTSLYDALHVDESFDFTEDDRLSIIRQTSAGLQYLHSKRIAHCDLKSQNVLLNDDSDEIMPVKLADFGLSLVISDGETSSAHRPDERVSNVGTPRYSAPEVLKGRSLSKEDMIRTDIYSLALIIYEVLFETEPFYNLTITQIRKQVGEEGKLPDIPRNPQLSDSVEKLLKLCLNHEPTRRPRIEDVSSGFGGKLCLYK